jgi:uncharacterized protein YydD (DUF2326 family)
MIHALSAQHLPHFKELHFWPGLNILLADKTETSTAGESRNGAGKSSFVELVNFLTGADAGPESIFRLEQLEGADFALQVDVSEGAVTVRRSGKSFGKTIVEFSTIEPGQLFPSIREFTTNNWREYLGTLWFGLPQNREKNDPSFRSLFSYFARRESANAFRSPFKHAADQSKGDQQTNLSYLLGLDWGVSKELQRIRDQERSLRELKRAATDGIVKLAIGDVADLRTRLAVAERSVSALRGQVETFTVVDEYKDLEVEASNVTRAISRLANDNQMDRQLIDTINATIQDESVPDLDDVSRLYREVGVVLPEAALARFEDVARFHASVVNNRQQYLNGERTAAETRISVRTAEIEERSRRRAQVMALLQSGGALEHFQSLQAELGRRTAEIEALRQQFEAAKLFEQTRVTLELERSQLRLRLQRDFTERHDLLDSAIVIFEELCSRLYDEHAGSLTIKDGMDGPEFAVKVQSDRSKGIKQMEIFCFDMMVMRLCRERTLGPGFLIHDSHVFDGVDGRQVGRALEIGAESAERFGFQYIVTMNSDALPKDDLPEGFDPQSFVLPVKLTDKGETGGIFGRRFQ